MASCLLLFPGNQNFISGKIGQEGEITSPDFPSLYPRDFGVEHVISCTQEDCIIFLIFVDFLISPSSIMEVKFLIFFFHNSLIKFLLKMLKFCILVLQLGREANTTCVWIDCETKARSICWTFSYNQILWKWWNVNGI